MNRLASVSMPQPPAWFGRRPVGFAFTGLALVLTTVALAPLLDERHVLAVALLYLLIALIASALWGYAVGAVAAIAADLLVNFFFVEPLHTLTVQEPVNASSLVLYLAVTLVGASMLALLRRQVRISEARRAEAETLLELTTELAHATSQVAMERLCAATTRALHARGAAILVRDGHWSVLATTGDPREKLSRDEQALANEAATRGDIVRFGAAARHVRPQDDAAGARIYVPIETRERAHAVLRIRGDIHVPAMVDADRLLAAFANEAALAIERSRLGEEARQAETLRRADEFKNVLLSSVSHDLRSPLTAIKAAVGSLRSSDVTWSDDDRESFLATIEGETDRLTATVADLLEMSRLEGGAVRPRLEPIELRLLLEDARESAAAATTGREVVVRVDAAPWVEADYSLILRALVNLIENAARYSRPGTAITLAGGRKGTRVTVAVADQGPGIAPADLPHIFEKFYRGKSGSAVRGTGLGLAIVRAMVELCRGTVTVTSSETGTAFVIELPGVQAPVP